MKARYVTAARLGQLERSLSGRDRAIITTLDELRVATTLHLRRLHFAELTPASAARQAPAALRRLADLRIVCQLERQVGGVRAGSAAAVWALDVAGQRLASACGPAGGSATRRPWTPSLPFVAHRLTVSELAVALIERARGGDLELLSFEAEPLSWRRFTAPLGGSSYVKPDATVRLAIGDYERGSFVEVDQSTESLSTIRRKCAAFRHYWETGREQSRHGYFPLVVFAVPDAHRRDLISAVVERQPDEAQALFRVVVAGELAAALIGGAA